MYCIGEIRSETFLITAFILARCSKDVKNCQLDILTFLTLSKIPKRISIRGHSCQNFHFNAEF